MSEQTRFKLACSSVFKLHDDSRYARVVLGSVFSVPTISRGVDGLKQLLKTVPMIQKEWVDAGALMDIDVIGQRTGNSRWQLGCEQSATFPKTCRAYVMHPENGLLYHLEVGSDFSLHAEPSNLKENMPDCVFGALLGAAVGVTEAGKLLADAQRREVDLHPISSDWRAPRQCFTLQTATGSPFVERWAFALQESATGRKRFRLWVEQMRTGKEVQVLLRENGTVEGIHDIEALPAAIHGAALGMIMGADAAVRYFGGALVAENLQVNTETEAPISLARPQGVSS